MKKILLVGVDVKGNDAISNIMCNIINECNNKQNICFYTIAINSKTYINDNIVQFEMKKTKILKIINKIYYILNLDCRKIGYRFIYKNIRKKCKNISFDFVISFSGKFSYTYATYKYAKKRKIKMKIIYFDPFVENINTKNKRIRIKDERKWLNYVEYIYYNDENVSPLKYNKSSKFVPFKIPISVVENNDGSNKNNYFVYGGTFYSKLRNSNNIFKIVDAIKNTEYKIKCFSDLNPSIKYQNIEFYKKINKNDYLEECKHAKALIYIGNSGTNCVSSKYLECIGMKKIIVGVNVSKNDEVRKYPFYFDYDDEKLIKKIESVSMNDLKKYNPYTVYKDRIPQKLFDILFN